MQKPEARLFRWLNRTEFTVTQKFGVPSTNPAAMFSVKVILSSHRVGARRLSPGNERAGVFYIVTSKYFARTMHSFGRKWHFTPYDITETGFLCARLFLQEKITSYKQVYKTWACVFWKQEVNFKINTFLGKGNFYYLCCHWHIIVSALHVSHQHKTHAFISHSCFIAVVNIRVQVQFHAIFQLNQNSIWSFLNVFSKASS